MISRRDFLKTLGVAAASSVAVPVIGGTKHSFSRWAGTSDKIRVALIGCRSMGWYNLTDSLRVKDVECVALCDIDRNILESRAAELQRMTGFRPYIYNDYREVLERQDIDAVIIGTPDHWHCLQMVDACSAGKHVYVEKPIANSIAECDAMVAAARRWGRVVQVGQQQRSGNHWHEMKQYIDSGKLGKISHVNVWANFGYCNISNPAKDSAPPAHVDFNMWLGPAPKRTFNEARFHGSWRMFWDYGGGLLTDWGVHLLDMALWGMNVKGMPKRVVATGGNFAFPDNRAETFDTMQVAYEFDDYLIHWSNSAIESNRPYGRNYGVEFVGQNGTLVANRESWEIYPANNSVEAIKRLPDGKDHENHVANFYRCVRQQDAATACPIDNGALCAKYAHLGNISARVGESLVFDDERKRFNHKAANELIKPEYRKPWRFPEFK